MKFRLVQVRPAPQGFDEKVKGLVTFDWFPDSFESVLTVTRWVKGRTEQEQGQAFDRFKFSLSPGSCVRVFDAQIVQGDRGSWLSVSDMEISREVRAEVCAAAASQLQMLESERHLEGGQRASRNPGQRVGQQSGQQVHEDDVPEFGNVMGSRG